MRKQSKTQALTPLTMLLTMAITVSMLESQVEIGIPGVRLGLANALGLIALAIFGNKEMLILNMMRVLIVGLMRGTLFFSPGFWISFFGTLLSSVFAILATKSKIFSDIGVSSVSATFHNVGQILFVVFLTKTPMLIFTYLPFMMLLGIPTGLIIGNVVKSVKERVLN